MATWGTGKKKADATSLRSHIATLETGRGKALVPLAKIESRILVIRGQRVMVETLSGSGASFCSAWAADAGPHHAHVYGKDSAGGTFGSYRGCKNAPSDW